MMCQSTCCTSFYFHILIWDRPLTFFIFGFCYYGNSLLHKMTGSWQVREASNHFLLSSANLKQSQKRQYDDSNAASQRNTLQHSHSYTCYHIATPTSVASKQLFHLFFVVRLCMHLLVFEELTTYRFWHLYLLWVLPHVEITLKTWSKCAGGKSCCWLTTRCVV